MQEKQQKILGEALKSVPFDGWSESTLRHAAKAAGLDENYAEIAFKGGVIDAISLFFSNITEDTNTQIDANTSEDLSKMKIRERIFYILDTRFSFMEQYKPVIRKTVQYLAMPQNICVGTKLLWEMADNIWYKAGDKSADFNYYTKRTTLMAIYSSTLLFWLNDESDNHADSQQFLKNRIDNVMEFEKLKGKVSNWFSAKQAS